MRESLGVVKPTGEMKVKTFFFGKVDGGCLVSGFFGR